jgi:hypothetical protein
MNVRGLSSATCPEWHPHAQRPAQSGPCSPCRHSRLNRIPGSNARIAWCTASAFPYAFLPEAEVPITAPTAAPIRAPAGPANAPPITAPIAPVATTIDLSVFWPVEAALGRFNPEFLEPSLPDRFGVSDVFRGRTIIVAIPTIRFIRHIIFPLTGRLCHGPS